MSWNKPPPHCQMTVGVFSFLSFFLERESEGVGGGTNGGRCFPTRVECLREWAEQPDIFWTSSKCWARVVKCCSCWGRGWKGVRRRRGRQEAASAHIFNKTSFFTSPLTAAHLANRPVKKVGEHLRGDFPLPNIHVRLCVLHLTGAWRVKFCSFLGLTRLSRLSRPGRFLWLTNTLYCQWEKVWKNNMLISAVLMLIWRLMLISFISQPPGGFQVF